MLGHKSPKWCLMASSEKLDNAVISITSINKKVFEQWTATVKVTWIYTI